MTGVSASSGQVFSPRACAPLEEAQVVSGSPQQEAKTPPRTPPTFRTRLTPEMEAKQLGLDVEGGSHPLPEVQDVGPGLGA